MQTDLTPSLIKLLEEVVFPAVEDEIRKSPIGKLALPAWNLTKSSIMKKVAQLKVALIVTDQNGQEIGP